MNVISFDSLPLNNNILFDLMTPYLNRIDSSSNLTSNLSEIGNSSHSIINEFILNMVSLTKDFHLGLSLGLIFIFSGLLFKIAAAPFHNWSLGLL